MSSSPAESVDSAVELRISLGTASAAAVARWDFAAVVAVRST